MKHRILFSLFISFTLALSAQDAVYYTGFDTPEQQAGWEQFRLGGEQSPFYLWEITTFDGHSDTSSIIHYYPVAATAVTDDWFVSPEFNFQEGAMIDSIWTKYGGFGLPMNDDTIALYLLVGDKDPELADKQILLHLFSDTNYMNDNTWRRIDSIAITDSAEVAHLAFRYTTMNNWLDVQFDDLSVTIFNSPDTTDPGEPEGIFTPTTKKVNFTVYPNPAQREVTIETESTEVHHLRIRDLQGREQMNRSFSGKQRIANLQPGVYHVLVSDPAGAAGAQLLIIE